MIYRKITCDSGQIDPQIDFEPRFDYARTVPTVEPASHGVVVTGTDETVFLSSSIPLHVSTRAASASSTLTEGETRWLVAGYDHEMSIEPARHQQVLDDIVDYWHRWAHQCSNTAECPIGGPWYEVAVRSALVLKLLIHRDTEAICAAPTTSLPEVIGGVRNWDYRFN